MCEKGKGTQKPVERIIWQNDSRKEALAGEVHPQATNKYIGYIESVGVNNSITPKSRF